MPRWWEVLVSCIMLFIAGVVVNRATVKAGIFGGFSSLPVSVYGFLGCGVLLSPNMVVASTLALLMAVVTMFLLYSMQNMRDKESLFTAALFMGIMPLVYPPTVAFVLILFVAIFVGPLSLRQIIIALAGYLIPFAGMSYLHWYLGNPISEIALNMWAAIIHPATKITLEPMPVLTLVIVAELVLVLLHGFAVGVNNRFTMLVPVRKSVQLSSWFLVVALATLLLVPGCSVTVIPAVAIPATVIFSFSLDRMESKLANIFYLTMVLLMLVHLFIY